DQSNHGGNHVTKPTRELAAGAAAGAAACAAAWDAVWAAAGDAVHPTVVALQESAFDLLDRLIKVTEDTPSACPVPERVEQLREMGVGIAGDVGPDRAGTRRHHRHPSMTSSDAARKQERA
ncbi:MAG: hypothetical protein ACRDRD_18640, partial [Pseudonocardiaceae bacterium]